MQVLAKTVDDLKSDRKDITPPLPVLLRLVPILFYCSIALAVILNSIYFIQFRLAVEERDSHVRQIAELRSQLATASGQRVALEKQIKKASDVEAWLESSRPLQPLAVAIARSIREDSTIIDLRMDRDPESPAQILFAIRLNTGSIKQLDTTLETIARERYRIISPTQNMSRGEVDYKAKLVWQDPSRDLARPATSATPSTP